MVYKKIIKRFNDFLLSAIGIIILSPLFLLIYCILAINYKDSPLFYQIRAGKNGKEFKIVKFKTMNNLKDANGSLLSDKERITRIGGFLRKTSLDEIPQLINVFKGEMSLIGPRPLLIRYLPYYSEKEKLRHSVRPGITGLAQISGRNLIGWDARLQKDVEYAEKLSFLLDVRIILKTIQKVLLSQDIATDEESGILDLDEERQNKSLLK
jgi:undecaprenyl phosphate N,N'-diacetylbacillosamine 1-phosphate transferase